MKSLGGPDRPAHVRINQRPNSWGLTFWCVESYQGPYGWIKESRFFLTKWGASRCLWRDYL